MEPVESTRKSLADTLNANGSAAKMIKSYNDVVTSNIDFNYERELARKVSIYDNLGSEVMESNNLINIKVIKQAKHLLASFHDLEDQYNSINFYGKFSDLSSEQRKFLHHNLPWKCPKNKLFKVRGIILNDNFELFMYSDGDESYIKHNFSLIDKYNEIVHDDLIKLKINREKIASYKDILNGNNHKALVKAFTTFLDIHNLEYSEDQSYGESIQEITIYYKNEYSEGDIKVRFLDYKIEEDTPRAFRISVITNSPFESNSFESVLNYVIQKTNCMEHVYSL